MKHFYPLFIFLFFGIVKCYSVNLSDANVTLENEIKNCNFHATDKYSFRTSRKADLYVLLTGNVNTAGAPGIPDDYIINFTNETGETWIVDAAADGTYEVDLPAGDQYTLSLSGANGYEISNGNTIDVTENTYTYDITIVAVELYTVSGSIVGLGDYIRGLNLTFVPDPDANSNYVPQPVLDINAETYTVYLEPNQNYTIETGGVNDYYIIDNQLEILAEDTYIDIVFQPWPLQNVNIVTNGLTDVQNDDLVLIFTNLNEPGYSYAFSDINSVFLRDGVYKITAKGIDAYPVELEETTNLTVQGEAVTKNLNFSSVTNWTFEEEDSYEFPQNPYASELLYEAEHFEMVLDPAMLPVEDVFYAMAYKSSDWPEINTTKDYFAIYSSDHQNDGGIYWLEMDDLNYNGIVLRDAIVTGYQAETPWLMRIPTELNGLPAGEEIHLLYHTKNEPGNVAYQDTRLWTTAGGDLSNPAIWTDRGRPVEAQTGDNGISYLRAWLRSDNVIVALHVSKGLPNPIFRISHSTDGGLSYQNVGVINDADYFPTGEKFQKNHVCPFKINDEWFGFILHFVDNSASIRMYKLNDNFLPVEYVREVTKIFDPRGLTLALDGDVAHLYFKRGGGANDDTSHLIQQFVYNISYDFYKGISFTRNITHENDEGFLVGDGGTIEVPLQPNQQMVVAYYYAADFSIGSQTYTTSSGSTSNIEYASYLYPGTEAGTVLITLNDTTYIKNIQVVEVMGAKDVTDPFSAEIKVYPNPTHNELTAFIGGTDTDIDVSLFNLLGKKLMSEKMEVPSERILQLDFTSFRTGIYFLVLKSATVDKTIKVVKL